MLILLLQKSPNLVSMLIYAHSSAPEQSQSCFYVDICSSFCTRRVPILFLCRYTLILLHHMLILLHQKSPNLVSMSIYAHPFASNAHPFFIRRVLILFLCRYMLIVLHHMLIPLHQKSPNLVSMSIYAHPFASYAHPFASEES